MREFVGEYSDLSRWDPQNAPLAAALAQHIYRKTASFHTPGHKGRATVLKSLDSLAWDLTELPDTGSLYDGEDVIEEAEKRAAAAFGAGQTFFSGGGCTLCIQAMLAIGIGAGGKVLMARNAHRSALNAAALLGLQPVWLWPDGDEKSGFQQPTVENVEKILKADPDIQGVYLTSPDYYGNLCDIAGIAAVCRRFGIPLLVDNAHGSHLGAFQRHPLALGASITADSAHKTLPVLTGGAYLHTAPDFSVSRTAVKAAMALFGSTSPAFPVLASLDLAQDWWSREGKDAFRRLAVELEELRQALERGGAVRPAFSDRDPLLKDPARLTLEGVSPVLDGPTLAQWLRDHGCEPEYADSRYVVLIVTPFNAPEEWDRLRQALSCVPGHWCASGGAGPVFHPLSSSRPEPVYTLREALLQPTETVGIRQAAGRIAARAVCPCPPGIAAIAPGEKFSEDLAEALESCGFSQVVVVKNL